MKKINLKFIAVILIAFIIISSCNKNKAAFKSEDGTGTVDNRTAQSENDVAVNDVNNILSNQNTLRGKGEEATGTTGTLGNPEDISMDTVGIKGGTVKLNFNGKTISNRTRTGQIILTIQDYAQGKRWRDAGCVLKVEYIAYKIVRASDQKSIQFDGVQNITNLSGKTWWELFILKTVTSLVHSVSGTSLKATFEDGKTATYNINRKITYSYPDKIVTVQAEGTGSSDGLNNLENYGTTRDGDNFTSQVTTPLIWNITCGAGAPMQGQVNLKVSSKAYELNCLFGVDTEGNSTTVASNSCPYGWKLTWSYKGQTKKKVFGYK